jgi:CheY-like chemotaxis protein
MLREAAGPLEGVLAMAELLERQSLGPDAAACMRTLRESAQALARAFSDARDLSSYADGDLSVVSEPFAVRSVVDGLQARWSDREGAKLLASYEGSGELLVCADALRLGQVFDALVGRAVTRSRGAVEASLTARVEDGRVRLSGRVRDDARDAGDPAAIFDLNAPGEGGLALALAAALIRQMGGVVSADHNRGAGTTVSFELQAPEAVLAAAPDPALVVEQRPNLHVLIVDDNATNRLVAEAFCDMFGCTSDKAEDGVEALEAVTVRRYDLVLMDIKMPRMDGVTATRAIRSLPGPERDTPVVALTANADPEDIREYVAAGMAGVVEKPIKADRLAEVIDAVLDSREAPAQRQRAAA